MPATHTHTSARVRGTLSPPSLSLSRHALSPFSLSLSLPHVFSFLTLSLSCSLALFLARALALALSPLPLASSVSAFVPSDAHLLARSSWVPPRSPWPSSALSSLWPCASGGTPSCFCPAVTRLHEDSKPIRIFTHIHEDSKPRLLTMTCSKMSRSLSSSRSLKPEKSTCNGCPHMNTFYLTSVSLSLSLSVSRLLDILSVSLSLCLSSLRSLSLACACT